MRITVELNEEEKEALRGYIKTIDEVSRKIVDCDLWKEANDKGYRIPEIRGAINELCRAKNNLLCLTVLDVVDNEA